MPVSSILVVDDEQLIRWSIARQLERAGYEVVAAETGEQALERLGDDVGLVLIDLKLPDMDGLELLEEIKQRRPDCRAILMTAYGGPGVSRRAARGGALLVLDKPFDLEEMTRAVEEALATGAPDGVGL